MRVKAGRKAPLLCGVITQQVPRLLQSRVLTPLRCATHCLPATSLQNSAQHAQVSRDPAPRLHLKIFNHHADQPFLIFDDASALGSPYPSYGALFPVDPNPFVSDSLARIRNRHGRVSRLALAPSEPRLLPERRFHFPAPRAQPKTPQPLPAHRTIIAL